MTDTARPWRAPRAGGRAPTASGEPPAAPRERLEVRVDPHGNDLDLLVFELAAKAERIELVYGDGAKSVTAVESGPCTATGVETITVTHRDGSTRGIPAPFTASRERGADTRDPDAIRIRGSHGHPFDTETVATLIGDATGMPQTGPGASRAEAACLAAACRAQDLRAKPPDALAGFSTPALADPDDRGIGDPIADTGNITTLYLVPAPGDRWPEPALDHAAALMLEHAHHGDSTRLAALDSFRVADCPNARVAVVVAVTALRGGPAARWPRIRIETRAAEVRHAATDLAVHPRAERTPDPWDPVECDADETVLRIHPDAEIDDDTLAARLVHALHAWSDDGRTGADRQRRDAHIEAACLVAGARAWDGAMAEHPGNPADADKAGEEAMRAERIRRGCEEAGAGFARAGDMIVFNADDRCTFTAGPRP